ncbi:hypothetical protein BGE01nite_37240 [Brevifollis gellanilyticus]|uniref:Uncharacterized protein n=1 Tax=Brevifollis gellanilyticus TaxID=748831 RepID=A0A512MCG7_9BACT|nr:hypothetical protein BGE01nite_37240 [Brevifollis gellanilyticus]
MPTPITNWKKEIAKFLCGGEAFHAVTHAYLLVSGTQLTVLGITTTPTLNTFSVITASLLAIALGIYAWRPSKH